MDTLQSVQALLTKEFGLAPEQVRAETNLVDLGIDSLATIEFMFLLEETFKLKLPEAPSAIKTVGDIAAQIDALTAQNKVAAVLD
jgi:acyl carrier protein